MSDPITWGDYFTYKAAILAVMVTATALTHLALSLWFRFGYRPNRWQRAAAKLRDEES